jgi:multisubunit Na+/H+ antiporter MnhC subunit
MLARRCGARHMIGEREYPLDALAVAVVLTMIVGGFAMIAIGMHLFE